MSDLQIAIEVDRLFEAAPDRHEHDFRENPVTGGRWVPGLEPIGEQKRQARRALAARRRFGATAPVDFPSLPVHQAEYDDLHMKTGLAYLLASFAASVRGVDYDLDAHPSFEEYARGVLACPLAPDYIRDDEELIRRFPPQELTGLGPGLIWDPNRKLSPRVFEILEGKWEPAAGLLRQTRARTGF